jgi:hypothetical protein
MLRRAMMHRGRGVAHRYGRALCVLGLVAGISGATAGCAYPGCTETTLTVEPIVVEDPDAPVTLSARLVDEADQPVTGLRVKFFVQKEGGGQASGVVAGVADTDADGVADLTRETGIYGGVLPEAVVDGYSATFSVLGEIDGTTYCESEGEAPINCLDGGVEGACPPKPHAWD